MDVLYPSGLYAAFTSDRDPKELESTLKSALEDNKLGLGSFSTEVRPIPGSVWAIDIDSKAVG